MFLFQFGRSLAEFIPRTHGMSDEDKSIQLGSEISANYVNTDDLLNKLPDGVKIAEDDGLIILYGVLYNNGSEPMLGDRLMGGSEVDQLSSKIVSIIKENGQSRKDSDIDDQNLVEHDEEVVLEDAEYTDSLIFRPLDTDIDLMSGKQSNDIIVGRPKYDILPVEPAPEPTVNIHQNLPRLDQHLFNLSTSFSFSEPPTKPDVQAGKIKEALGIPKQHYGSNNPLHAEPITQAIPRVHKTEKTHHKVVQGRTKPSVTLIYPEDTFLQAINNPQRGHETHKQAVGNFKLKSKTTENYSKIRRRVEKVEEPLISNAIENEEVVEEPFLETDNWQIYWDTLYNTWYYFDKNSGESTWTKPQDLMHIHLKDQTQGETRRPKMKDEVAVNTDLKYNPLPSSYKHNQNIPLHNPSKDFYLFTNTPKSQTDSRKIPDTLPLPPHPPPHLAERGHRRVDVVEDSIDIPRPPGLPMKYNLPPYIQLLGREQSPLGYQREYVVSERSGASYQGYRDRFEPNRRIAEARVEEDNERSTSSIVNKVWKNTIGNLFGRDKDDEDTRASRRRKRRKKDEKKERKSNPIFDMVLDIATKSAVKYAKSIFLKDDTESDIIKEQTEEDETEIKEKDEKEEDTKNQNDDKE